ncbi:unnamed protein product [Trichobilharzia szidati]|nr:unnamed protein product [Trichobilharzia szidati]
MSQKVFTNSRSSEGLLCEVIVCARDYSIVSSENDMQIPINLITEFKGTMYESYGSVWYHQINNQTADDVYVYTHISSGMEFNDPSKACLSRLLQTSIKLRLLDLDMITKESGREYTFKMNINGPEIIIKGPCERVYELYKQLLENTTVDFTKEHFIKCKKQLTEELTAQLSNPNHLADNLNTCLWNRNEYTIKALLLSLTSISIADLMAFHSKYFFQLAITMYVVGDMQEGLAKDLFISTIDYFNCHPKSDQAKVIDNIPLRPGIYYHSVTNASIPEKYYQLIQYQRIENTSPLDEIYCKIIIALVKTHAQQYFQHYESLNGQVVLDLYELTSTTTTTEQVIGTRLCLISQSMKHDSDYLISCVNIFWQQIATRVIACAEHKTIEQIYDTINSNDTVDSSDVKQLSQFYWNRILNKNETFDGRNEKNLFKKEVSREKLLDYFYRNYLNPSRQISVFIDFRNTEIQNDHQNEPSNTNKTNSTNCNANLNSYLKDEDLMNLPQGTGRHLINVLNEQTPAIQITRKIENIESFRFRYKKEAC